MRRARRRRTWMCPYAVVSFAEVDRRPGPREALPPQRNRSKARWGEGERGPRLADVQSHATVSAREWRAPRARSSRAPAKACGRKPRASKGRSPCPSVGSNHRRAQGSERTPRGDPRRKPGGSGAPSPLERAEQEQRTSCRTKASRAGESAPFHDGEAEAVLAVFAEPVSAHRETARPGIQAKLATEASEARSFGRGRKTTPHPKPHDPPKRCGAP